MTESQEKKLDDLHAAVLRLEGATTGRFGIIEERLYQNTKSITENEKNTAEVDARVRVVEADRNKVIGVIWLSCTTFFLGAIAFIGSLLKR